MRNANEKGFTIIETFVSLTILLAAIAGPLFLVTRGVQSTTLTKQRLIASYLAIEGIEFARATRDNNVLQGLAWNDTLSQCDNRNCAIDVPESRISGCNPPGTDCGVMQRNTESGLYAYDESGGDWEDTIYTRQLRVTPSGADEMELEVTVFWESGAFGGRQEVVIDDHLLNWF